MLQPLVARPTQVLQLAGSPLPMAVKPTAVAMLRQTEAQAVLPTAVTRSVSVSALAEQHPVRKPMATMAAMPPLSLADMAVAQP